jgi:hypothetical protein
METRDTTVIERFKIENGVEMCFCSRHKDYSPCSDHTISRKNPHGYDYYCKQCLYSHRGRTKPQPQSEFEKDSVNRVLISLGYDLNSSLSIHDQFLIKHNL